jgi:7-cyano-7-deazaguanine synthase in queuosine biosynthesis
MLSKGSRDLWCGFDYGKGKTNRKAAAPALDKSPEFVRAFEDVTHAMWNGGRVKVHTPLMKNTKVDTVKTGLKLGTPFDLTWTCYNSLDMACGVCSSCKDRLEAFKTIGIEDPAPYVTDEHFLKYYKYPIY